ncbi:DUF1090 domain-containing protein [Vibrio parahaemolyticus]|uniref:DUF1090 domain-containing protein n=1 Tax=Vibrio parahaemolyticus TaxID=670 RepID=UPI00084B5558|nr:DUF1090 domain-containing protein [Vibrio parahaemolyticus]OEA75097.1 hypothetical protein BBM68_12170 [Vibrio parahaemolyticus]OEA77312.1 hypothetical protein BBM67_10015 [Vibrio parahaemolyticus]
MKAVIFGAVLTMAISLPTVAQEELKGCDAKAFALEQQIEYATVQGNQKRIDGLKRALAAIEDECSEEDLREKLQAEIEQKAQKVKASELELAEAQTSGSSEKIEKKRRKLDEAQQEWLDAKRELEWNYGQ